MIESDQDKLNNSHILDDEIDLRELFKAIWDGKKLVVLITSIVGICSIVFSLMLSNYYSSYSVLVTRSADNAGSLSQYSGLASLAGIKLPSSGDTSEIEVMEIIKSREFLKHLTTFEDVLPSIMAAESYDEVTQELYFDPEIYDKKTKTWTRKPNKNKGSIPSYIETHKIYLDDLLSLSHDNRSGLIQMNVQHISPVFAKEFLELVIREANAFNREIDIDSSSKALSYLILELSKTSSIELKKSINQLIKAQLETQMMANIHDEYVLIALEPPFIPEEKSWPSRAIIVILASILGSLIGMTIVLIRHYYFSGKDTINK
tara:strand:- start:4236 stop:5189 length:954 start_codon:yes stop_codon:yes gene_type:complete